MWPFSKKSEVKQMAPPPPSFPCPGTPVVNFIVWYMGRESPVLQTADGKLWVMSVLNGELRLTEVATS